MSQHGKRTANKLYANDIKKNNTGRGIREIIYSTDLHPLKYDHLPTNVLKMNNISMKNRFKYFARHPRIIFPAWYIVIITVNT